MVHQGHNVKRIREILGIKQDALAIKLGLSQQAISQVEQKEILDKATLEKLSSALGISEDTIKDFKDEKAINIFSNNYHDNTSVQYNFNPIDRWLETIEENKKLYERLLQSEKEKVELLERLLKKV
ncbi:helix-turn-helix transcriptional regulator [Arcicella aquatica]|uniref:Helix-turn-helix transcriptional regulator n=1 Tax=Arcicella aquatica TaxID=217141 RepID=A0ABU5QUC3_9BACT|nr:helix-turn-helix transcriptional regulator [Arcicella aquatica]MEA5260319.1 helix-turn-helix transcriptional regulator [Arcicella aquatica]